MSRTLFWYVLRDLLKVFFMTSGVLAGIMSFGGLLRPLTQYGLTGSQVAQMLAYFMPAAQTYSLPIAALFATTVVYGRLSADNELTACRATGISYLSMSFPAFVLGLTLAIVSLLSLCFVVPHYTLKVEKTAFASLAEIVQKNIERTHQIKLQGSRKVSYTLFAESATVVVVDPSPRQALRLLKESRAAAARGLSANGHWYWWDASYATHELVARAFDLREDPPEIEVMLQGDVVQVTAAKGEAANAELERVRFPGVPAPLVTGTTGGPAAPQAMQPDSLHDEVVMLQDVMISVLEEDELTKVKWPTVFYSASIAVVRIRQVDEKITFSASLADGMKFPRTYTGSGFGGVGTTQFGPFPMDSPIKENTKFMDIRQLQELYKEPTGSREIRKIYQQITEQEQEQEFVRIIRDSMNHQRECRFERNGEAYTIYLPAGGKVATDKSKLSVSAWDKPTELGPPVRVSYEKSGDVQTEEARGVTVRVSADPAAGLLLLELDLKDVAGRGRKGFSRPFSVAMPKAVSDIAGRGPAYYLSDKNDKNARTIPESKDLRNDRADLKRRLPLLQSSILAEIHARISFSVSCLILVMMGCALGMMFRTGNYLSAFAISVSPALLCLALVITGQHVSEASAKTLSLGLGLIWSGNVIVFALAIGLLRHLKRQ